MNFDSKADTSAKLKPHHTIVEPVPDALERPPDTCKGS
jgi:hypothetical protein